MIQFTINRIEAVSAWFILLSGWPRLLGVFLAGSASALSMPPFDFPLVLFLTFPVLVWTLDSMATEQDQSLVSKAWRGFKPGFLFAFGYFLSGLWWIGSAFFVEAESFAWAAPIAVLGLPTILALFWGFATALALIFWPVGVARLFLMAALIGLAEHLRGHVATGLPWNTIGYAAAPIPILMQTASVFGVYGLSILTVFVSSWAAVLVPGNDKGRYSLRIMSLLVVALLTAHIGYGILRLPDHESAMLEEVSVRLVQPAVPQADKFDPVKHPGHFKRYMDLSSGGLDGTNGLNGITHLIWPESVFPYLLTERKDTLAAIAAMLPEGTSLVTGAARAEASGTPGKRGYVFNSVYVINDDGVIISAADKVHLVPFGEYLPFQKTLEAWGVEQLTKMEGGFEPGADRKLLSTGTGPGFLPLICYEIIFPGAIWEGTKRPGFIVNLTNDAWFGYTPGPYQHERQAVLRAVEEGLPLVRVANSGISGVYDAFGRTVKKTQLGSIAVLDSNIPENTDKTVYSRYGGWINLGIFLLFGLIGLFPRKTGKIS